MSFRNKVRVFVLAGFCSTVVHAQQPPPIHTDEPPASDAYALTADSLADPAAPHGEVFEIDISDSKIFPETTRTISVYVPAEYKPETPACVYVGLDGLGFRASTVFDNLIARHAMPVTIGIGIAPGRVGSSQGQANPRFDRSFEFDSSSDRLTRFILEEVLPAVQAHATKDGRRIVLSGDPNDRAIGGASTGGIGAFTVAWEHPEAFRRVFSAIGTYVGMRGGERYYVEVRKTEPKPIRIFMQDGVHDEWPGGPEMGDWWMSNQTMERALTFAGYDVEHVWGAGTHNGSQADSIFPQAMKWLWLAWPAPVQAGVPGNPVLKEVLEKGEEWKQVADCPAASAIASDPQGHVYFWNGARAQLLAGGPCETRRSATAAMAFDAHGSVFIADESKRAIFRIPAGSNEKQSIATGVDANGLVVRQNDDLYFTSGHADGEVWLVHPNGIKTRVASGLKEPSGLMLTPDGLWLFVAQKASHFSYSYRVQGDGSLDAGIPFYDVLVPGGADDSGAGSVWMDTRGLAYTSTVAGIQIFDRNGRVAAILPLPGNVQATSLCFGGEDFHMLYVSAGGKVFARRLNAVGAPAWNAPLALPPWGAG